MPVYVDDMHRYLAGHFCRLKMSRMLADTDTELHAMALQLGLDRRCHSAPPIYDSHYGITKAKRAQALAHGAIAITWRQAIAMNLRRRATGQLGDPATAEDWAREFKAAQRAAMESAT